MKVLFIGGTGNISEAVSRLALERGIDLYLLNRGQRSELFPERAKLLRGDIRDPQSAAAALQDHQFDVVVDWIAFTPDQVRFDIDLFKNRTGQYIFISSASAYQKPVCDYLITESTPLVNPYWQYSRDKIACEELLMDTYRNQGFPITIVRPSHTYGMTSIPAGVDCWGKPWTLIDRIRRGKKIIIHGDGSSLWVLTHNTDFAVGFVGLLGNPRAIGQAFHITSDEVLSWNQIYQAIGNAAGVKIDPVYIPSDFLAAVSPWGDGLLGDKSHSVVFDNRKIKRLVPEFAPEILFSEGIKQSLAWFEDHPDLCEIDHEWNRQMDRIIEIYEEGLCLAKKKIIS